MSTINADNLTVQNLTVSGTLAYSSVTAQVSGHPAGTPLEVLSGRCNGEGVTVGSGTYIFPSVTAYQAAGSVSWIDIIGSEIAYTPPSGTKRVLWDFQFSEAAQDGTDVIISYKPLIDGTILTNSYRGGGFYRNGTNTFRTIINCDAASDDAANGNFTSWSSAKTLKWQLYNYSTSFDAYLHTSYYWEATGSFQHLMVPTITITALA